MPDSNQSESIAHQCDFYGCESLFISFLHWFIREIFRSNIKCLFQCCLFSSTMTMSTSLSDKIQIVFESSIFISADCVACCLFFFFNVAHAVCGWLSSSLILTSSTIKLNHKSATHQPTIEILYRRRSHTEWNWTITSDWMACEHEHDTILEQKCIQIEIRCSSCVSLSFSILK